MKIRSVSRDSISEHFHALASGGEISPDSINQTYWEQDQTHSPIGVRLWEFSGSWQATRAWQALAGDRDFIQNRVFAWGSHWILAGSTLAQIDKSGPQLLSADEIAQSLTLSGWEPGHEPAFSRIFLQQRRLPFSGSAIPENYLGLPWSAPVYGMRYAWYGDTVQVVLAGPQDSIFLGKWHIFRQQALGKSKHPYGSVSRVWQGPKDWFWAVGPLGVVGMQGCFATKACSNWVEEQYQLLEIFERDGFFARKNASLN